MKIFDVKNMPVFPLEQRGKNVFYKSEEFKTRIIELHPGGEMPECEMASNVIFYVIDGMARVNINGESSVLQSGQCLITEPATLSMTSKEGVKIMGIQVFKNK